MLHYGLELEFFIYKGSQLVPAYLKTNNTDGNIATGELKTKVHTSLEDAVFEMNKLIFLEKKMLKEKGCSFRLKTSATLTDDQIKELRRQLIYAKKEWSEEFSIYGEKVGKILPIHRLKASLQINISDNYKLDYYTQASKKASLQTHHSSSLFNYIDIIRKWDTQFKKQIEGTDRVPGVYSIKHGEQGNRIEYRSLPNNINLMDLLK